MYSIYILDLLPPVYHFFDQPAVDFYLAATFVLKLFLLIPHDSLNF